MNNIDYDKLIEIVVRITGVHADEIKMDTRFSEDLGADSLDMYQMAMETEKMFQLDLSGMDIGKIHTVEDAFKAITGVRNR